MLPENELINDFQIDLPYERGPVVSDYMRNEPEAYRHKHFPKPTKITLDEIWLAMEEARVKMFITVKSILCHCYSLEDARLSISQMRVHRPEYFRKAKR